MPAVALRPPGKDMKGIFVLAVLMLVLWSALAIANEYGAIAYDRQTGSWGASYDQGSQNAADERAMIE